MCSGHPSAVKNRPSVQETQVRSLGQEAPQRRKWQLTSVFRLENSMGKGAWWAIVHKVAKELDMT